MSYLVELNEICPLSIACILNLFIFYPCDNSIIGGSLIIAGLYTVTWASYKERQASVVGVFPQGSWVSEPLIDERSAHQKDHIFSGSSSVSPNPKPSD